MEPSMFGFDDIINNRKLSADDVLKINFIIKNRADRYIAASRKEFLFPEKVNKKLAWNNIFKHDFLLPDPRELPMITGWAMGNGDKVVARGNEYRQDKDDEIATQCRDREWVALRERQDKYNKRLGEEKYRPAWKANQEEHIYRPSAEERKKQDPNLPPHIIKIMEELKKI